MPRALERTLVLQTEGFRSDSELGHWRVRLGDAGTLMKPRPRFDSERAYARQLAWWRARCDTPLSEKFNSSASHPTGRIGIPCFP
jgi:hypothetical protein